jgi:hypothetical protein
MDWPGKPRALVAARREEAERLAAVLSGYARRFAHDLQEARRAAEGHEWTVIVVEARFRGRGELLEWLRERSDAPVVEIDLRAFPYDYRGYRVMRRSLDALVERASASRS